MMAKLLYIQIQTYSKFSQLFTKICLANYSVFSSVVLVKISLLLLIYQQI